MYEDAEARPQLSTLDLVREVFFRSVAALCAGLGLLYWIRLIGVYEGLTWRFDLMPVHWQVAAICLAVLYPFAASGLWMLASWGPVIWIVCAAAEVTMYAGFPSMFGRRDLVVAVHLVVAAIYVALRVAKLVRDRRKEK